MKIKVSGTMGMKMMMEPYSPADVSSFVEIEQEVKDSLDIDDEIKKLQEISNNMLKADVINKMKIVAKEYADNKEKLKRTLGGN